jgi:hypothetical protein
MRNRSLRASPLAMCLGLSLSLARDPAIAGVHGDPPDDAVDPASVGGPPPWWALQHRPHALTKDRPLRTAGMVPVVNCADSGGGSLRAAAANAVSGDTIDMTQLTCGQITLTTGAVMLTAPTLTLRGPSGSSLTITANSDSGLLRHVNGYSLAIHDLKLTKGLVNAYSDGYDRGGCLFSEGDVYLENVVVEECAALDSSGGGIWTAGALTMVHSRVSGSTAGAVEIGSQRAFGGGIYAYDGLYLSYSTISNNEAYSPTGSYGGGAFSYGDTYIFYSTITGNRSGKYEGSVYTRGNVGGLDIAGALHASIFNSTISGNYATGSIGGMYADSLFAASIINSTIAFNTSRSASYYGAGLHAGDVNLLGSIVSNNTVGGNAFDLTSFGEVTGSGNLIMAATVSPPGTITGDPHLLPLRNNGGPTGTHALAPNSPAINQGNNIASAIYDQRGTRYLRVFGAAADIGAFELQPNVDRIFADGFE